ncbi:MAG TPA: fatty acid--CoA ligase family protein [Acidimicrobiales bacterium]
MTDATNLARYLSAERPGDETLLVSPTDGAATRGELRAAVFGLTRAFREQGLVGARVGLDITPGFGAVAAYLALLACDNTAVLARRIEQPPWPSYLAAADLVAVLRARESDRVIEVRRGDEVTTLPLPPVGAPPVEDDAIDYAVPTRPAVNLFTSGTTGRPKMVELSHAALRHSCEAILDRIELAPTTRTALVLSLAHSFGLSVLHTHLRAGASLWCVERAEFPGDVLRAFTEGGANAMAGVPTQLRTLTTSLQRHKGAPVTIDLVLQAGGRMEPDDAAALLELLTPDARLFPMYGQTEASARIAILPADAVAKVPDSVGLPIRGLEVRVVDEAGDDVPTGEEGEIIVTGPTLMDGYYRDPDATAEVLRDGWLFTGDIGRVDEDGFLYVSGRRSTFVKLDGERISLEAVEHAVLSAHPEVQDALAVPVKTDRGWAIALEVLAPADPRALKEAVRLAVGRKAVPAAIRVVEKIPYTDNGKKPRPKITY